MYSFLHDLLADKKGGEIFRLFGVWHFVYIVLAVAAVTVLLCVLKNKGADSKRNTLRLLSDIAFGLYIADFFLMPLAYGEIDIEKLPFHACTATCVACFLSYRVTFLSKYRTSLAMLAFISNFVYLIYPAGVMWHAVGPLSYRVVQTLIFHTVMTVYGFLTLVYDSDEIKVANAKRDSGAVLVMTLWAVLGNCVYNGTSEGYSHFFNWFFVVRDPFYAIPERLSPFVMPFLNVVLFVAVGMVICFAVWVIKQIKNRQKA